jgi:hypothetical protein
MQCYGNYRKKASLGNNALISFFFFRINNALNYFLFRCVRRDAHFKQEISAAFLPEAQGEVRIYFSLSLSLIVFLVLLHEFVSNKKRVLLVLLLLLAQATIDR